MKNGEPLDPKQVSVRNSETDTILFIRRTDRKDSGIYELQVQIENVEDKASVTVQIVGTFIELWQKYLRWLMPRLFLSLWL